MASFASRFAVFYNVILGDVRSVVGILVVVDCDDVELNDFGFVVE